jgi:large-conductance mechanosensitive channel
MKGLLESEGSYEVANQRSPLIISMDEISKSSVSELPASVPDRWLGLVVAAVVLGEAIWGLLLSLSNNLLLPLMARVMGGDSWLPLHLSKGEVNVTALFSSILGLCLAGIVFVFLNQWSRRKQAPVRLRTVSKGKTVSQTRAQPLSTSSLSTPALASAPVLVPPPMAAANAPSPVPPIPVQMAAQAQTAPATPASALRKAAKQAKPKPPKQVFYNIVGEPINPTEDE